MKTIDRESFEPGIKLRVFGEIESDYSLVKGLRGNNWRASDGGARSSDVKLIGKSVTSLLVSSSRFKEKL